MKAKKLTLLVLLGCAGLVNSTSASNSMNDVFDQINAYGNISSPAVLQGQTMNYGTGGSLFMRTPRSQYNIASITMPSASAGCGGIDLYMGGFGFINKDQFVSMMKNIGSAALGYGFKLALQNLCPTCDNVMQALQSTAQQINRMNIDSCEAAKGIVNAATSTLDLRGRENSAINFGVDKNIFGSISEAWASVKGNQAKTDSTNTQLMNSDPAVADNIPYGNVVWKSLKKMNGVDDEYRMILMSLMGTTVFKGGEPVTYPKLISSPIDLIGERGKQKISVPVYKCADGFDANKCTSLVVDHIDKDSFYTMVYKKMDLLVQNISSRQAYSPSEVNELIQFLNVVDFPVYKMLAVSTRFNNTGYADQLMSNYAELVAAKYAQAYIQKGVADLRAAITKYRAQTADPAQSMALQEFDSKLTEILTTSQFTVMDANSRVVTNINIGQEIMNMERALNANLSQPLRQSLAFGNSLK